MSRPMTNSRQRRPILRSTCPGVYRQSNRTVTLVPVTRYVKQLTYLRNDGFTDVLSGLTETFHLLIHWLTRSGNLSSCPFRVTIHTTDDQTHRTYLSPPGLRLGPNLLRPYHWPFFEEPFSRYFLHLLRRGAGGRNPVRVFKGDFLRPPTSTPKSLLTCQCQSTDPWWVFPLGKGPHLPSLPDPRETGNLPVSNPCFVTLPSSWTPQLLNSLLGVQIGSLAGPHT